MLSSFTLISLLGVMLGVLVLVVVMAVYAGLERNVKSRLLGFTPHILLRHQTRRLRRRPPMDDWQEAAAKAENPAPRASRHRLRLGQRHHRCPVLAAPRDVPRHRHLGSRPGRGHRQNARSGKPSRTPPPISASTTARSFPRSSPSNSQIGVGDKIRLYSTRNFEEVMRAYKATENPPVREAFAEAWNKPPPRSRRRMEDRRRQIHPRHRRLPRDLSPRSKPSSPRTSASPSTSCSQASSSPWTSAEKDETAERLPLHRRSQSRDRKSHRRPQRHRRRKDGRRDPQGPQEASSCPRKPKVIGVYQASQMAVTPGPLRAPAARPGSRRTRRGRARHRPAPRRSPTPPRHVAAEARQTLGAGLVAPHLGRAIPGVLRPHQPTARA